jgi:hypothetical protein
VSKWELGLSKAKYFDKLVMDESLFFTRIATYFPFCREMFATEERLCD